MDYQELIVNVATETGYTKREIRHILRVLARTIVENVVSGRDVQIWELGTFKNLPAKARVGRHAVTGDPIPIPEGRRVKFEPMRKFKSRVRRSLTLLRGDSLEMRFGLPRKEKSRGKVRSSH